MSPASHKHPLNFLHNVLWARRERPVLERDEEVLLEGTAILRVGLFGLNVGPLILTNRRVIWYESSVARPFTPVYGEISLPDIDSVDRDNAIDRFVGGHNLPIHLRSGKAKTFAANAPAADDWMTAIQAAINQTNAGA